ncbi:MAG: DNA polymerase domain-containing protein [Fervidicoccaceae archaeon]
MKLGENWNLKAEFLRGKIRLLQLTNEGELLEREINSSYPFYLIPHRFKSEEVANSLKRIPFVREVAIEEWFLPPWYEVSGEVVRVEVDCYQSFLKLIERLEDLGIERVNVQPSAKSLVLMRKGIPLLQWEGKDPWDLVLDIPSLRILRVKETGEKIVLFSSVLRKEGEIVERRINMNRKSLLNEDVASIGREHHISLIESKSLDCRSLGSPICIEERRNPVDSIIGLIELSRISFTNLRDTARRSIGQILTEIEALEAFQRKMLIPKVRSGVGGWRSVEEMLRADNGGLVGLPRPGLYRNALQLDFSSLYPAIIAKFNISPETVERPGCSKKTIPLGSLHSVCLDRVGIVSQVLSKLVERRELLKATGKWIDSEREKALKWIMVASFGYLGYRNARFGSVLAYESVVSISREIMRMAMSVASEMGYKVIHFIVDSLFLWKSGDRIDYQEAQMLRKKIEAETGMKLKIEALYKYLVIPRTNNIAHSGAPNRYYGITDEGRLVIKGVRCPELEGVEVHPGIEQKVISILLSNNHPRRLCPQLSFLTSS